MPSSGPSSISSMQLPVIYNDVAALRTILDIAPKFGLSAIGIDYPALKETPCQNSKVVLQSDTGDVTDDVVIGLKQEIEEVHGLDCVELYVCPQSHLFTALIIQ